MKTKRLKSRKIVIFPNSLVLGSGQKFAIFFIFFILCRIGQENVVYDILEPKNTFLGYKNKKFKHLKIWDFSKGVSPWFWSKIGHFSFFFYLAI